MTFSLTKLLREPPPTTRVQCELCAMPTDEVHGHVVDTKDRRLLCTCYACGLLFSAPAAAGGRFKLVPKRYAAIPSPLFSDAQWDALGIPIGLAFFFENGDNARITAFYPGPAGATQSQLPLDAWEQLRAREPLIASMQPDVEAALVYRRRGEQTQSFVVPIDVCYELAGIVRSKWDGISGGEALHRALENFFTRIAERAV
jgi:Family of unknown function (DUF5947)